MIKNKSRKRALCTGAAGFIGSNLTKRLVSENWHVDVVDDLSSGYKEFLLEETNVHIIDFADYRILDRVRSGKYDVIFHQAAMPRVSLSVEKPYKTTDVNIAGTVGLMEAAIGNVRRFVFASSSSVYGGADNLPTNEGEPRKPVSPYALQKKTIEEFAVMFNKLYGLDIVCLRYFNVFGPNQFGDSPYSTAVAAWCDAIKNNKPLRSDGDGEQSRDMCYVDNVVDANLIVANHESAFKGDCFNVACGDRTSNNEILENLKARFGDLTIEHAPERPGDVKHTLADISKLKALGYEPKVRFWEGLTKTLEWWGLEQWEN